MKKLLILHLLILLSFPVFPQSVVMSPLPTSWEKGTDGQPAMLSLRHTVVLFNKSSENADYTLRILDESGEKIGYKTGTLPAYGNEAIDIDSVIGKDSLPASVKLIADNVVFLIVSADSSGERLTSFWPPDVGGKESMWINHIASERDQFFTAFSGYALTDADLQWEDAEKTTALGNVPIDHTLTFELNSIYPGTVPGDVSMAKIQGESNQSVTGIECFGNWNDKITFATLPTTWFSNTRLIFPHIAYSKTLYWTGLVIGNPNNNAANIKIRFMGQDGSVIQTQHTQIPSLNRIVMLFASQNTATPSLPEEIPDGAAWIDVFSDVPLTGFELFGGNDTSKADYMEGIRATGEPFEKGAAPYIIDGENRWAGIALVNTLSIPLTATLTLVSPAGQVLETTTLDFNPFEKKVDLLRDIFSEDNVAAGGSLLVESSEKGSLVGIIVYGDDNVTPRKLLGGYEIIPMNNERMYGPYKGSTTLPRFGINGPNFDAAEGVTVPGQDAIQNEMAWISSGQPYRFAIRHLQTRDLLYSDWIDDSTMENRKKFLRNSQGFSVMPTLIGFRVKWNGLGENDDLIDMNDPQDVQQLENYVKDVVQTFPEIKYYEIFNETFGDDTLGMANFAQTINKTVDAAREVDPDILFSFPHLLGTTPTLLQENLQKLEGFASLYPDTLARIDVYGIHYYGHWQQYADLVRQYLIAPMAAGDIPEKPWVISETGISSKTGINTVTTVNEIEPGPENQAAYMVKMFTLSFALGAETVLVHSFQSGSPSNGWAGYGMIDDDTSRKPEGCTLRYFADAVRDFTSVDTLDEGEDGVWLYRFNNANRLKGDAFVAWKEDGTSPSESTLTLLSLAGQPVTVTELVPYSDCTGNAGDFTSFSPDELFTSYSSTVNDDGTISLSFGGYPIIIQSSKRPESSTISISTTEVHGTIQNLMGVIAGPHTPPQTPLVDLTAKLQDIGVTSIRNNGYYDDSLDIESIFQCPDTSVYPSWDCDATNDAYYHWEPSDTTYSSIVDGGFEPFLRLGGEVASYYQHHDFAGPREDQEDNWIIAAEKMVARYKDWNGNPPAFQYLDIWTEWPNSDFWDRSDADFISFWAKVFRAIKITYPQFKLGGPGFLKPTVDVIDGRTDNNKAINFLRNLYLEGLKPDWIGFHLWQNDPTQYYKAVKQYRNLLNGTGDFSDVPWAGSNFFEEVEIICGAYGFGQMYDSEDGTEHLDYSKEFLFNIMNRKKGAAMLCADFIALQQGGAVRAYYYRSSDERPSTPDVGADDPNRGWTGLCYGDDVGTPKPDSNAFRLYTMLYAGFPSVLTENYFVTGDQGHKIYYIASKGDTGTAILLSNIEDVPQNVDIYVDGVKLSENPSNKIKIYRVDNEHNGSEAILWQGNRFRIPPECTEVIVIEN